MANVSSNGVLALFDLISGEMDWLLLVWYEW